MDRQIQICLDVNLRFRGHTSAYYHDQNKADNQPTNHAGLVKTDIICVLRRVEVGEVLLINLYSQPLHFICRNIPLQVQVTPASAFQENKKMYQPIEQGQFTTVYNHFIYISSRHISKCIVHLLTETVIFSMCLAPKKPNSLFILFIFSAFRPI